MYSVRSRGTPCLDLVAHAAVQHVACITIEVVMVVVVVVVDAVVVDAATVAVLSHRTGGCGSVYRHTDACNDGDATRSCASASAFSAGTATHRE